MRYRRDNLKVVILCGGKGLRMKEVTGDVPKPLAMIGNKPILWHIMKTYYHYGFNEFVLLLGYKGDRIKEYFMDYEWKNNSFRLKEDGHYELLEPSEKWNITFLDTGLDTMTGGRLLRAKSLLKDESFMLTYGDGLADININKLVDFHIENGKVATVTGINKSNQYGVLTTENNIATEFIEKPTDNNIINGGFFVFNHDVFDYLRDGDKCILERDPLVHLVEDRQLAVYNHNGFWTAMDTYKDIMDVNKLWVKDEALWKVW
ncbi:MAG: rfbF [Clostridia bacterium]|jgi:glucose-1-phosphate cytidylyltransferase|nr:rfbF [Clostridia bacterium]